MAFPLSTRVLDELITPTIWNADVVGNLNNSVMHLLARRTSNQSVTSSTVLVSDDTLTFAVAANAIWEFEFRVRYDASATGDIKYAFSLPTSGQIDAAAAGAIVNSTGAQQDAVWQSITTTDASPLNFAGAGAGTVRKLFIFGTYTGAGTAGNVTLRFAQNTSDGVASRNLTNSTAWGANIA